MGVCRRLALFGWLVVCSAFYPVGVSAAEQVDMAGYYDLIYQIRVVAKNAGSKSSIGSGFQVSEDGLIVTNYHVVSMAVDSPATHRIEYLDQAGNSGELSLLDFDVVNDLAVLRHPAPPARHFEINELTSADPLLSLPAGSLAKGEMIYALGNPHDLGITLKLGAYNGIVEHSYNPQILFSGSLNPGMSGGPGLLADGSVIGVNVATAGSDLSFLVPAAALRQLIDAQRTLDAQNYPAELALQVARWQRHRYENLLALDWPSVAFGNWPALDEIRKDMQCWGSSNEDEDDLSVVVLSKGCDAGNRLYLGDGFSTGHIHYSFSQRRSVKLSPLRFHTTGGSSMYPDNAGDSTKLTEFVCDSKFVELENASDTPDAPAVNMSLCTRAYVELPELFDVMLLASANLETESYTAHFALAGVPKDLANRFTRKFLSSLGWR